ncbi:hypothetical protein OnM2_016030 [Erysiphe neolycopersici]|uniref:DRBM domain-containing protein n=1 Tax=Erysiphe neolycopersici TaxID=212602 RepID=A0A420I4W1_9PEZI|nr:hypothetical protein OnM2_016030 [Erysiphe neolycopersici]
MAGQWELALESICASRGYSRPHYIESDCDLGYMYFIVVDGQVYTGLCYESREEARDEAARVAYRELTW